jgi:hypothetical protein
MTVTGDREVPDKPVTPTRFPPKISVGDAIVGGGRCPGKRN